MEWFRDVWTLWSLDVVYKADSLLSESNICHHNRWQKLVDESLECTVSELEQILVLKYCDYWQIAVRNILKSNIIIIYRGPLKKEFDFQWRIRWSENSMSHQGVRLLGLIRKSCNQCGFQVAKQTTLLTLWIKLMTSMIYLKWFQRCSYVKFVIDVQSSLSYGARVPSGSNIL